MKTEKQYRQMERKLSNKVKRLRGALKVIHTWAGYDLFTASPMDLWPPDVMTLCGKVLKETEGNK